MGNFVCIHVNGDVQMSGPPLPISDIDSGSMRENTAPEVTKGVTVRQLP